MADTAAFERRAQEAEQKIRDLTARFDAFTKGGDSSEVTQLRAENARLKAELAALKGGKKASPAKSSGKKAAPAKAAAPTEQKGATKTWGWQKSLATSVDGFVRDVETLRQEAGWPGTHWLNAVVERSAAWAADPKARDDIGFLMQNLNKLKKDSDAGIVRAAGYLLSRVGGVGAGNKKKAKKEKKKGGAKDQGGKKNKSKKGKGKKGAVDDPAAIEKAKQKKLKAILKEGGKKGQDMDGMAAFGTEFFCASVQEPDGKFEWMDLIMSGFNKKVDPSEEERRGGAGGLGKMLFSAGTERLAILAHVPAELTKKYKGVTVQDWLGAVLKDVPQCKLVGKATADGTIQAAEIVADPDNNIFPLKIRDQAIQAAYQFLMANQLAPQESGGEEVDYTALAEDAGVTFNDAGDY